VSREYYDAVLSKTDPLMPMHVKLPRSVVATLNRAARKRQRYATFVMREALMAWAKRWQEENPAGVVDDEEEFEDARGKSPKKRKRA
jgi:predicted transcriptional regulator